MYHLKALKTYSLNQPLNISLRSHINTYFSVGKLSQELEQFLFISHERFLYLCFCLCSLVWGRESSAEKRWCHICPIRIEQYKYLNLMTVLYYLLILPNHTALTKQFLSVKLLLNNNKERFFHNFKCKCLILKRNTLAHSNIFSGSPTFLAMPLFECSNECILLCVCVCGNE